jgi:hypothetical protein
MNENNQNKNQQKGFIKSALIIVGSLVILKYTYHIDIIGILTSGKFKVWLDSVYKFGNEGWEKYQTIILKIWYYLIDLIRNTFNKKP